MRHFHEWEDELWYRVKRVGNDGAGDDEKHAGGVYDMAIAIAIAIENEIGREFEDIDKVVGIIYDAIKYGKYVE